MIETDLPLYDRLADVYETPESLAFYRAAAELLAPAIPQGQGQALDLGCGSGISTQVFAAANLQMHWHGLDISTAMLALARSRPELGEVDFVQGAAERLPYPPASFDRVLGSLSFHWFGPQVPAQLARVLRPGGQVALLVPLRQPAGDLSGNRLVRRALFAFRGQVPACQTQGINLTTLTRAFEGWDILAAELAHIDEKFAGPGALANALESRGALQATFGKQAERASDYLRTLKAGELLFRWVLVRWIVRPAQA